MRFGGAIGEDWEYRVFGKVRDIDGNADLSGNPTADRLESQRIGVRIDRDGSDKDRIAIAAEAFDSELGVTSIRHSLQVPYTLVADGVEDSQGAFTRMSWDHENSERSRFSVESYYDQVTRDFLVDHTFEIKTLNLDFQHELDLADRHKLIWGSGYRRAEDNVRSTSVNALDPAARTQRWISAFVQDEFALKPEKLYLTIGSKFEHTNFTLRSIESQPNIRLRWDIDDRSTFWASIAKAVRLPSRGDLDGDVTISVLPPFTAENPGPFPTRLAFYGDSNLRSEELIATELGYRIQPSERLAIDLTTFLFDYDHDRSITALGPRCQPQGTPVALDPSCFAAAQFLEVPLLLGNDNQSKTYGWELVTDWWPADWWRMQMTASVLRKRVRPSSASIASGLALLAGPEHQATLRSMMNLGAKTELDLTLRYVDDLDAVNIEDYTALDLRLGWTPRTALQTSLVGRNLLAGDHQEFISELSDVVPVDILRRAYLEILWSF
jgi:iron complex outermembrane receptor protein